MNSSRKISLILFGWCCLSIAQNLSIDGLDGHCTIFLIPTVENTKQLLLLSYLFDFVKVLELSGNYLLVLELDWEVCWGRKYLKSLESVGKICSAESWILYLGMQTFGLPIESVGVLNKDIGRLATKYKKIQLNKGNEEWPNHGTRRYRNSKI